MNRIKIIAATLALVAILAVIFSGIALAAGPDDNSGLPACCQQQGQAVPGCCAQLGDATGIQGARDGCCGR